MDDDTDTELDADVEVEVDEDVVVVVIVVVFVFVLIFVSCLFDTVTEFVELITFVEAFIDALEFKSSFLNND